ncbi:MAG: DUF1697 domain-containing protein [Thermoanaerobaculia bacterium]|nr:DUF1697 domain-containing protein [Thermoanaerobaculia bacterium]
MPKNIAFLRAINVGGHTVKMDRLRALFVEMGFSGVETFIASGNVIFDPISENPAALEKKIESHLESALGYEVRTFIRTSAELAAVVDYEPFSDAKLTAEGSTLYVGFLPDPPTAEAIQKLLGFSNAVDEFHVAGREVYWLCHKKFHESDFSGAKLEKVLGLKTTLRNVSTVRKLAAKYPG